MIENLKKEKQVKKAKTSNKGITLIALVITIIVLLILAGVSIVTLTGENGILTQAQNAKTETKVAELEEELKLAIMGSYGQDGKIDIEKLNDNLKYVKGYEVEEGKEITKLPAVVTVAGEKKLISNNGSAKTVETTVAEAKIAETIFNKETILVDSYENPVTIPEGFKIASDSATEVAGGVVIEDARYTDTKGSQFVWIPVGTITGKINGVEKTETITLRRYDFTKNSDGTVTTSAYAGSFIEEDSQNIKKLLNYGNAIAENIGTFKSSANNNSGYYIGRYEAGLSNTSVLDITDMSGSSTAPNSNWTGWSKADGTEAQIVCEKGKQVWNYITQNKASELSKNMYTSSDFTSDLVNSYAWDTAIVFIQTFGKENDSTTYSHQIGLSIDTTKPSTTGTGILSATNTIDKQCNIFDMAGNCYEWSTETDNLSFIPCVRRGGRYNDSTVYTGNRSGVSKTEATIQHSFRPLLYL